MTARIFLLWRCFKMKEGQAMRIPFIATVIMITVGSLPASAGAEAFSQEQTTIRPRANVGEPGSPQSRGGMLGRLRDNPRYTRTISGTALSGTQGLVTMYSLQYSGA